MVTCSAVRHHIERALDTPSGKRGLNRRIFAVIAPRYDLITRLLSYGQDQRWKAAVIDRARIRPGERVLDVACGTGDLALRAHEAGARVAAIDLTHAMLVLARRRNAAPVGYVTADMMDTPFASAQFDVVTAGYGLRNLPDLDGGLAELARLVKPGGRLLSLDFDRPENGVVRTLFLGYLWAVGSLLGWLLHGDPSTYRYIAKSLARYPGARQVADRLRKAGFGHVECHGILGGLMAIHVAERT